MYLGAITRTSVPKKEPLNIKRGEGAANYAKNKAIIQARQAAQRTQRKAL